VRDSLVSRNELRLPHPPTLGTHVVEPLRQALGEAEFTIAADKLTNSIRSFCASVRDDAR
jgi:hypothetical protein